MPVSEAILSLEGVTLTAPLPTGRVAVLRDINLSVERGRILGLVGESGAGKSMIGRLVSGLLPAGFAIERGTVRFEGVDLLMRTSEQRRDLLGRRIAFIPQEPLTALNPVLTIGQHFDEHLARLGRPKRERAAAAIEQLANVQLPTPAELLRRYPHELSGGQCQRVLIALAFASNPTLIIADEPTTALDVVTQAHVMRLLADQQRVYGTAVVLITHDLRLAAHVCDEVGVMYAGDMIERGPAGTVLREPMHPYTRILKLANPSLEGERRVIPTLGEFMPGLSVLASMPGCRFAPRCAARDAACERTLLALREVAPGHAVRCADACAAVSPAADAPERALFGVRTAETPSAQPLLELRDVDLRYTSRRGLLGTRLVTVDAVKGASFKVFPRERVGIVGESGSGKSSVARLIVGLEQPTGGELRMEGKDAAGATAEILRVARESIQIVFQDPQSALNPRRSVLRLVTQVFEVSGREKGAADRLARARELLQETGLPGDCLARFPGQLSGGQRQRVNIARALCVTPKLLVADEIVSGLDVSVQAQIMNLLLRLSDELGLAMLFISHDLSVVRYLCSRVLVMHRGEIVETGDTERVFAEPRHAYTRALLGAVPPDDPDRVWPPAIVAA